MNQEEIDALWQEINENQFQIRALESRNNFLRKKIEQLADEELPSQNENHHE